MNDWFGMPLHHCSYIAITKWTMLVHCNTITILPSKGCIYLYCATLMDSLIIDVTSEIEIVDCHVATYGAGWSESMNSGGKGRREWPRCKQGISAGGKQHQADDYTSKVKSHIATLCHCMPQYAHVHSPHLNHLLRMNWVCVHLNSNGDLHQTTALHSFSCC